MPSSCVRRDEKKTHGTLGTQLLALRLKHANISARKHFEHASKDDLGELGCGAAQITCLGYYITVVQLQQHLFNCGLREGGMQPRAAGVPRRRHRALPTRRVAFST